MSDYDQADIHRSFPHSPEAEKGVLSAYLLAPDDVGMLGEDAGLSPEHFYLPTNQELFRCFEALRQARKPVEFVTVAEALRDRDMLEKVGGAGYINELFTHLPSAANVRFYVDELLAKRALRRIIETSWEWSKRAFEDPSQAEAVLDGYQAAVLGIVRPGERAKNTLRPLKDGVIEAVQSIYSTYQNRGGVVGLATGFHQFDRMTGGLLPGQLFVIGGRPSMGKSALLWDMALHIMSTQGAVLGFSLEMTLMELAQRYLCWEANINLQRLRDGFLSQKQMDLLNPTAERIAKLKGWVDETPGIAIQDVKARARRFKQQHPEMRAIFIDYLQLMKSRSKRAQDNRVLEIGEISGGLKELGKELGVPVIVGAQLNRDKDGASRPPTLANLRESGTIEQDADIVGLLHRRHYYTKDTEDEGKGTLILGKQRNGPTGDIDLGFTDCGRFINPAGQELYSNNPEQRQGGSVE